MGIESMLGRMMSAHHSSQYPEVSHHKLLQQSSQLHPPPTLRSQAVVTASSVALATSHERSNAIKL